MPDSPLDLVVHQLQLVPHNGVYAEAVAAINELMLHDMDRLISILYRMDVSERKLKETLEHNNGTDAAELVLKLMIERQAQKIKSRQQFSNRDRNISDDERW